MSERWRKDAAELLRDIGQHCIAMARALDEDDDILGSLAGMGLANHLPLLPAHIRAVFMEHLDDEAARGARADAAYLNDYADRANARYLDPLP